MNDDQKFDPEDNETPNDLEFLNRDHDPDDETPDLDLDADLLDMEIDPVEVAEPELPEEFQNEISADYSDDPEDTGEQSMATPQKNTSARSRLTGSGPSRIMIGAGILALALAVWVFWPRGGPIDTETLGDTTVLTLDPEGPAVEQPLKQQSSDVDLANEVKAVVPEKPDTRHATPATAPKSTVDAGISGKAVVEPGNNPVAKDNPSPSTSGYDPSATGKWAIQLGAFGSRKNAQNLAGTLQAKGYRVETPAIRSSSGSMSYKVWIAFFATRAAAHKWAKAHGDGIGSDYYINHR